MITYKKLEKSQNSFAGPTQNSIERDVNFFTTLRSLLQ